MLKRQTLHGEAISKGAPASSEYSCWLELRSRCRNPRHRRYKDYGGRGITVCERWDNSFENFLADMGRRPSRYHSIDRKDNDRGYSPGNCRWATREQQRNNQRRQDFTFDVFSGLFR
jgi:hypothetical protein